MHWDTAGPQHEAQELWQAGREGNGKTLAADLQPSTQGNSNIGPTSASAVVVQKMIIWAVGNALPMMQGGPRHTARAPGVVRETGGTGRITGCGARCVSVNGRSK